MTTNISTRNLCRTTILGVLGTAATALAQEAGHGGAEHGEKAGVLPTIEQGIAPMVVTLVVFGIVFAILAVKVWPMMAKGLKEREAKIREEIESAERARKQAKDALEQYQKSLAEARAEAQRMLEATKAQQQQLAAELRAKADAELTLLKDRARRDIDSARRAALVEIHDRTVELATSVAAKILRREVTVADQRRLLDESLVELAGTKN
jgi:F-type H+-transporting ATPase subunit b